MLSKSPTTELIVVYDWIPLIVLFSDFVFLKLFDLSP